MPCYCVYELLHESTHASIVVYGVVLGCPLHATEYLAQTLNLNLDPFSWRQLEFGDDSVSGRCRCRRHDKQSRHK